jgi:hypothetical protein
VAAPNERIGEMVAARIGAAGRNSLGGEIAESLAR